MDSNGLVSEISPPGMLRRSIFIISASSDGSGKLEREGTEGKEEDARTKQGEYIFIYLYTVHIGPVMKRGDRRSVDQRDLFLKKQIGCLRVLTSYFFNLFRASRVLILFDYRTIFVDLLANSDYIIER